MIDEVSLDQRGRAFQAPIENQQSTIINR